MKSVPQFVPVAAWAAMAAAAGPVLKGLRFSVIPESSEWLYHIGLSC